MHLDNFILITFKGLTDGNKLTMVEPFESIRGKKLLIKKIEKSFYAQSDIIVTGAEVSSLSPVTYTNFKVVKKDCLIPKTSAGWNLGNSNQYFQVEVNKNIYFNKDTTKNYYNVLDNIETDFETAKIESFNIMIKADHYENVYQSTLFSPVQCVIKITAELI
ncbi:hypothetical protein MROS_2524 [Melioribacter roseus P3M-2]|jgi:hypothetical protein|uniref:Uncharacterized protein n=1 Tax=Melioribacter roseus (strain DSM 23840 / JCM 17771 / VKM B-2668 / P3M-2) TaxID=1191523 RepID=I6ZUR1_MELRP|nr:hypothetical protein [Melioribacter roseus]AFN75754.1 hypothetical protein MROS_2524 [Melioribacter roseus P3M-2]